MSLQGTFDTLSVTELFGLLATAAKTGALRFEAGDHEASIFVTGGLCCAVESEESARPAASDTELAARLVDVGFAFGRHRSGVFRFSDSELAAYDTDVTTPLTSAAVEIQALLGQWRDIEATIPSLEVRVRLAAALRDAEIVVSAQEWGLLVALQGTTPSVRELVARCHQPLMQVCRDLKSLIDRGAVEVAAEVGADRVPADNRTERGHHPVSGAASAAANHLEPSEPYAPGVEDGAAMLSEVAADAAAAAEAGAVAAAAEVSAVAGGALKGMNRPRRSVPDVFATGEDPDAGPAPSADPVNVDAPDPEPDPVADEPAAAPPAAVEPDPGAAAQDRGALLRLFSALKE